MTVALPTEPANYFHLLRRHALDGIQRPLVVFTPKWMLRAKQVVSPIADFTGGRFRHVIDDPRYRDLDSPASGVRSVILCTGKIYYELAAARDKKRDRRRRDRPAGAALPDRRPADRGRPRPVPERRGLPLGAGGAGQPGRVAVPRAGAAGEAAAPRRDEAGVAPAHGRARPPARRRCTRWSRTRSSTRRSSTTSRPHTSPGPFTHVRTCVNGPARVCGPGPARRSRTPPRRAPRSGRAGRARSACGAAHRSPRRSSPGGARSGSPPARARRRPRAPRAARTATAQERVSASSALLPAA